MAYPHTFATMSGNVDASKLDENFANAAEVSDLDSCIKKVVVQVFATSGTYTPTSGMLYCIVECVGGGGGGGGASATTSNTVDCGSGGGAGGYARRRLTAAEVGSSKTVMIGAGGSGSAGGAGSDGGTTSFGTLCVASGGSGGSVGGGFANGGCVNGGSGGAGSAGDFLAYGGNGQPLAVVYPYLVLPGGGGNSIFGRGGQPVGGSANGNAGYGKGAGGGGANNLTSQSTARSGGAGSDGICIVTEFCA